MVSGLLTNPDKGIDMEKLIGLSGKQILGVAGIALVVSFIHVAMAKGGDK